MEGLIAIVLLLVVALPIAAFIWLASRTSGAAREIERLEWKLDQLDGQVRKLRDELEKAKPRAPPPIQQPRPEMPRPEVKEPVVAKPAPPPVELQWKLPVSAPPVATSPTIPPQPPVESAPEPPSLPGWNWEQFMGVKMIAWIGGFVLFLAMVFFLKYAFEEKLIGPEVQMAIEYVIALGLLGGGLYLRKKEYAVLSQTLCATSVVALYAVTFAGHSYYQLMGIAPCFAVMVLVTAVAFLLAVRLEAQVVAVLGLLGGFLTPVLLSTGKDNALGLFSYIALLDAGLVAVVTRKRWNYLVLLAAVGTVLMQIAWTVKFFAVSKVFTAMSVFLGFEVLFLIAFVLTDREDPWINTATIGMAFAPLVFTLYLLDFAALGARPGTVFTFVLAADLGLLALVLLRSALATAHLAAGGAAFLLLGMWTVKFLSGALLNWALGFYLLFAILHTAFPIVLQRLRPGTAPVSWGHLFPPLALLLIMVPVVRLPELTWMVWLCVLALDVVVFALALVTASALAIIGALVLTLAAAAIWIFKVPATLSGLPDLLVVVGGFAVVFFVLGIFTARRAAPKPSGEDLSLPSLPELPVLSEDARAQVPSLSAILPFILLIMVVMRMPLTDPSPVFGLAMLLVALLLGVARWTKVDWLTAVGLLCCVALEYTWHQQRFKPDAAVVSLVWYLAFTAVFTIFPFVFRKALEDRIVFWAVAALAGPMHFTLVYRLVKATWPNPVMGLLPAAFAVPALVGLVALLRSESKHRLSMLAWFGGATLFFVTLIFPIQFERQWITIGWALEGAALLWLFHRVPHSGLRVVGAGLLVTAFVRLALNPAVLEYHARSATPILNWYLYAYGIATACLFVGSKLAAKGPAAAETGPLGEALTKAAAALRLPALLATLGTILAFLLLNIEIADYFTPSGTAALTFQFSGNFTRDMTYSIAWAAFALVLLVFGIARKLRPVRIASLALLGATLLKLFLHDLGHLGQLQRIGAFVGVAVALLVSSFLYQRFVAAEAKAK